VTEGVLLSSEVRETHPLKILLGNVQVEDVESLPGVVDGDRMLIISKGNYLRRGIKDGKTLDEGNNDVVKDEGWRSC
jgi:hypothetical protein